MTVVSYPQSQSPGSELMSMFSSDSANKNGAFNFPGIQDQDVDKLIEKIIYIMVNNFESRTVEQNKELKECDKKLNTE